MDPLDPFTRYAAYARLMKELGSSVVVALIAGGLVYIMVMEVRPAFLGVGRIEAALAQHTSISDEMLRLTRIQCRAARTLNHEDPNVCEEQRH